MKKFTLLVASFGALAFTACGPVVTPDADDIAQRETQRSMQQAQAQIGMPRITEFQEKRWVTYLYELRDSTIGTHSYMTTMDGTLIYLCPSVGYGINSSLQLTNPERVERNSASAYGTLPQPEPNGLFTPDGLASTFALCADSNGDGMPDPMYVENEIIVSLTELPYDKSWWTEPETSTPEVTE